MLEVLIWSLFIGSLGIDSVLVSGWLRWQQKVVKTQNKEEEEILPTDENQDKLTGDNLSGATSLCEAKLSPLGESPNRLKSSSSARQHQSRTETSRQSSQSIPKKNSAKKAKETDSYRLQHQTVLNHSTLLPSQINQKTLTQTQTLVNGFHYIETIQQPMYFTASQKIEWEYKIVRANYDFFRDYTNFMRLCEEESQAGWILLEKLDDRRVRFKRSVLMRDKVDVNQLSFDPYRCHYGPSHGWLYFVGAIAALTAMILPAYLGYTLVSQTLQQSTTKNSQTKAPLKGLNPEFQPPQIP